LKVESNMKNSYMKIWHYFLIVAATILLAASFFLPNAVAGVTDANRLDNLVMIDSQSISFDSTPELALPERLALIAKPNTEILPLKTGNVMDIDAATEKAERELERFLGGGPFRFDFEEYSVTEGAAALVIDSNVPTLNMLIWELVLTDSSQNTVTVTLDDETGIIIKIIYRLGNKGDLMTGAGSFGSNDEEFYATARSLAEMMKEYYGLAVTLADYQFNRSIAYYRADLFGGSRIIPMYGAVRTTSLTMNERRKAVNS